MNKHDDEFDAAFTDADRKFKDKYIDALSKLKGLTEEELKDILPTATDKEIYENIIELVQEATERNMAIGELRQRIERLGESAITIVKKLPVLKDILND